MTAMKKIHAAPTWSRELAPTTADRTAAPADRTAARVHAPAKPPRDAYAARASGAGARLVGAGGHCAAPARGLHGPAGLGAAGVRAAARDGVTSARFTFQAIDFSRSMPVISRAQKFVLPVPAFAGGGEPLVYPAGHAQAGQPVLDWQGKPIGDRGLVFFNDKDQAVQAVKANGEGVVIINQVSEAQAEQLMQKVGGDPRALSLGQLKAVLEYARGELGLGDMYNSSLSFIASKMNALEQHATGIPAFGLHRRDDRDVCRAVYVGGRGELVGTATTHKFDHGAVILQQGSDCRLVQPEVFVQTYARTDGGPIDLAALPRQDPTMRKRFDFAKVDFSSAAPVVSSAQKFVLPVPAFADGGEPLVYPAGHAKAGQPVVDWQGKPIGDRGLVFFNDKDQAVQAVKANGAGVVIINQVSAEQAERLMEKVGGDPRQLTLAQLKAVLEYARGELGLGDMYNSDTTFIGNKMQAIESKATGIAGYGLYRRDDRDVCQAVFVEGRGEFEGTSTTHTFEDGAVILRQGVDYRLVQPETFAETYRNKDGTPVQLATLPRVFPG